MAQPKRKESPPAVHTAGVPAGSLRTSVGHESIEGTLTGSVLQFNRETLSAKLRAARIGYVHLRKLGGLRHSRKDSRNMGWRNASFRGFAGYMQTLEFEAGLQRLMKLAAQKRSAIMCAEAVPWRCHRSLIADALTVRGIRVEDIMSTKRTQIHSLAPFARVQGHHITYPAEK